MKMMLQVVTKIINTFLGILVYFRWGCRDVVHFFQPSKSLLCSNLISKLIAFCYMLVQVLHSENENDGCQ